MDYGRLVTPVTGYEKDTSITSDVIDVGCGPQATKARLALQPYNSTQDLHLHFCNITIKMPRSRSRSRSPRLPRDEASGRRSRSPRRREDDRPRRDRDRPRGNGGFKWKEKRRENPDELESGEKRLERGYRKRSASPRRREKALGNGTNVNDKFGITDKFGSSSKFPSKSSKSATSTDTPPERPAAPTSATAAAFNEPMIIVHVNDRLGTKAAIPCLASDPIKLFKAQVAARIGREPHEILLKRQGERPFKDQLTLEDYGVSNGVQLDLEVDTGD